MKRDSGTSQQHCPAPVVDKADPIVDVVIVTYNAAQVISQCLRSIAGDPRFNIVVVDNASTDETLDILSTFAVRVVASEQNLGFGAASNLGAQLGEADHVLFLNPDTVADADSLVQAVSFAAESQVGILGCRLVQQDGRFDHAARRSVVPPWEAAKYLVFRSAKSQYLHPSGSEFETAEVDSVNGAFMLISRSALNATAGFDEDFWMYMEDVDLCIRAKALGYRVLYWPKVTVLHLKSATTGRARSARMNYHFYNSLRIFYVKHQKQQHNAIQQVLVSAGITGFMAVAIVRDWLRRRLGIGLPYSAGSE